LLVVALFCGYAAAASEIPPGRFAPVGPGFETNPTNVARMLAATLNGAMLRSALGSGGFLLAGLLVLYVAYHPIARGRPPAIIR
jgi:hypothetical protein